MKNLVLILLIIIGKSPIVSCFINCGDATAGNLNNEISRNIYYLYAL